VNPRAIQSREYIAEKRKIVSAESRLMDNTKKRNSRKINALSINGDDNLGIDFSSLFLVYDKYVRGKLKSNEKVFLQAYLDWKESGHCFEV
jgi:hypothetical protein